MEAECEVLKIGSAVVDISPEEPVGWYLGGYEMRKSDGIHDPLTARAVVLRQGDVRVAVVTLDFVGMFYPDSRRIAGMIAEKTGIPAENVLIHTIHTHSAPDVAGIWGGVKKSYKKKIAYDIVDCVKKAVDSEAGATAWFASGKVDGLNMNRRNPDVDPDRELAVMEFRNGAGDVIATLVNFACHPVILGGDNLKITADYPYYLRKELQDRRGGTAMYFSRDIGNANPPKKYALHDDLYERRGGTFEMAEEHGKNVAEEVMRLLENASERPVNLRIVSKTITAEVENPILLQLIKIGMIKRKMNGSMTQTVVSMVDLGPAQIVTFPGEALPALKEDVEKFLPGPFKFFLSLTNDCAGYIVSPREWDESHYEEGMCMGKSFSGLLRDSHREIAHELFR